MLPETVVTVRVRVDRDHRDELCQSACVSYTHNNCNHKQVFSLTTHTMSLSLFLKKN